MTYAYFENILLSSWLAEGKLVDAINGEMFKYDKTGDKEKDEKRYQEVAKVSYSCQLSEEIQEERPKKKGHLANHVKRF